MGGGCDISGHRSAGKLFALWGQRGVLMDDTEKGSRRSFIAAATAAAGGLLLAGCAGGTDVDDLSAASGREKA